MFFYRPGGGELRLGLPGRGRVRHVEPLPGSPGPAVSGGPALWSDTGHGVPPGRREQPGLQPGAGPPDAPGGGTPQPEDDGGQHCHRRGG